MSTKGSGNLPFSEYLGYESGFKAMDWNFQNTWTNLCNNMVEEKAGIEEQNSKFEKNEHACIVEGVSWVYDRVVWALLWLLSPSWDAIKVTQKVGFTCPFVVTMVIDPTY